MKSTGFTSKSAHQVRQMSTYIKKSKIKTNYFHISSKLQSAGYLIKSLEPQPFGITCNSKWLWNYM